jgi:hypothetical protein
MNALHGKTLNTSTKSALTNGRSEKPRPLLRIVNDNAADSAKRESPAQPNERSQPRHWNVYNYSGEYEFPTARHWTSPDVPSLREVPVPASREGRD